MYIPWYLGTGSAPVMTYKSMFVWDDIHDWARISNVFC